MFDPQVVDYIKKALAAGQTQDQIKAALTENGWSEAEIAENVVEATMQKSGQQPQPQTQAQPRTEPQAQTQEPVQPRQQAMSQQSVEPMVQAEPQQPKIEIRQTQPAQSQQQAQPQPFELPESEPQQPLGSDVFNGPESAQGLGQGLGMKREAAKNYTPPYDPNAGKPEQSQLKSGESVYQFQHQPRPKPEDRRTNKLVAILVSLAVIIILGCLGGAAFIYFDLGSYIEKTFFPSIVQVEPGQQQQQNNQTQTLPETIFAKYLENTPYTTQIPEYTIMLSELTNLANFEQTLGKSFTEAQRASLAADNFFITSNFDNFYSTDANAIVSRNDDWTGLYKTIGGTSSPAQRKPDNAVFITSDYLTHVYHRLVEQEFTYIEETKLYPTLASLSNSMLENAKNASYTSQEQQESNNRLIAYFLVSSAILNNAAADYATLANSSYVDDTKTDTKANVLANIDSLASQYGVSEDIVYIAKQEINLIFDASRLSASPLFSRYQPGYMEDYTQYGPRSHYARNVILRDYFRAMMWFGRMNFLVNSTELTRDAANMVLMMNENQIQEWKSIYEPTSFFVGKADDLTIEDMQKAMQTTGFSVNDMSNTAVVNLQTELKTYSNPTIMSSVIVSETMGSTSEEDLQNSTKGFRFMGQRTTPDAFIFSELTQGDTAPDPATGQRLPSTPTALMVSTLMGDVVSKDLLNTWIANNAASSDKVLANKMASLQTYFDQVLEEQWTQNIYWSWIYSIKSLFNSQSDKTGYPMFMKTANWDKKQTQAFLGSWTELKHDTLLYAKQSYAELGAGGEEQEPAAVPKGYVEPNIEFFDRLIALVKTTNEGLTNYNLMPELFQSKNSSFIESLEFFRQIAVQELANQTISDTDFERLRLSAYSLDQLLAQPGPQAQTEANARSALIADVHTDAVKSQILYQADGIPNYIYVAVKDANGTRLTKGLVYSYYEFTNPLRQRLTDQTWQQWNYSSTIRLLKMPDWNAALIK